MQKTHLTHQEQHHAKMIIQEKTGYMIRSTTILNQIFRRSSLTSETGQSNNEIFEFLGDQILSFYVVKIITGKCGVLSLTRDYIFRIQENQFTQIKQALVNNETLAKVIEEWGIVKYLCIGKSDVKNEVTQETKVKADLLEAVLGGIAVDCNWDPPILEQAVTKILDLDKRLDTMIENDTKARWADLDTAVTILKEEAERHNCTMPKYDFSGPDMLGYDGNGNSKWNCSCSIVNDKIGITRLVNATSKKDAKKAAAYLTLCEHWDMPNKYGPNHHSLFWTYKDGKLFPEK